MPRHKYVNDDERQEAIREYRKRYHAANREAINARSAEWKRINRPAKRDRIPPPPEVPAA